MKIPLLILAGLGGVLAIAAPTSGEFDLSGLNDQVQEHEVRIDDLETKTTETEALVVRHEAAITQLQTAPAPAPAPAPTPTPPPAPVVAPRTVTSATPRQTTTGDRNESWCDYEYSDGTSESVLKGWATPPNTSEADC